MEVLQAQPGDLSAARVFLVLVATATILYFTRLLLAPLKRRRAAAASSSSSRPAPSLPRPRGLPVIGNLHQLGAVPHDALAALAARHAAPLMLLRLGSVPALVVSTADALRAAFQPNDRAMSGRPALAAAARITYGLQDIVFSPPDGAFWRAARRASLSELLSAPRVRGFRGVREGEAAALVAAVADASRNGAPVNLGERLMATSNRILRRVAFGDDDGGGGEGSIEAGAVLDETQKLLGAFFVADYMPWLGWLDTLRGLRRRLERNFHELDAFYEKVIDDHLNKPAGSQGEDLVDVMMCSSGGSGLQEHVQQPRPDQRHPHGHVHCRDGHDGGDGGVDDDRAGPAPGHPRQGAERGARRRGRRRRRRRRHRPRVGPPAAQVPEAGDPGVDAGAPAGAAAGAPGDHRAVHGVRLRDPGGDAGAGERPGHRAGPRRVGPRRGAVRARAARGGGGPRRPQALAQQLLARAVRGRAEELPRRALRHIRRRAAARQPALLL